MRIELLETDLDQATAAAIVAAVACVLAEAAPAQAQPMPPYSAWRTAARREAQNRLFAHETRQNSGRRWSKA